jgi:hypothetical protein
VAEELRKGRTAAAARMQVVEDRQQILPPEGLRGMSGTLGNLYYPALGSQAEGLPWLPHELLSVSQGSGGSPQMFKALTKTSSDVMCCFDQVSTAAEPAQRDDEVYAVPSTGSRFIDNPQGIEQHVSICNKPGSLRLHNRGLETAHVLW